MYSHASDLDTALYCHGMTRRRILAETGEVEEAPGCESKETLVRLIGAPAPPVVRAGKWGSPSSKREEAVETRKMHLKRSYDHEFRRGGKGVEERRARIDELKKQKVPIAGHHGF